MRAVPMLLCFVCVVVMGMVFVAAQWQLEIADNFMLNGWGAYKVFFNMIVVEDVWAVRDFWMLTMDMSFVCGMVFFGGVAHYAHT